MLYTTLLAATATTVSWSPSVGIVMILCNLFAIAIGYKAIQNPGVGPALPVSLTPLWKNFGVPELLGTACLGHILGAGIILGLANAGVL
ncbi:photosystem I reaction center subunit PsaK [Oxynema aestuarii]|uniref:Photosystem I reaction center subunit PsaK n=1 Tax=Oxynema aestuarii AP17 TaxID=2064643 RepID=A0A6H1TZ73_9CYAN|nr:photosystem I reaction center subunit PsaK [Oxynema aestuarii]QIZ71881.1 photosystem I reaction center subunit PsaK [Oxynema aestuarii AP17]RMH72292.1 MAG: photosystem I reaction center subunit PsaK [Cyanobacteria bacterium J007]